MLSRIPRFGAAVVIALTVGVATAAEMPLIEGDWVQVKGQFRGSVFQIDEIERRDEREFSVKGPIAGFNPDTRELRFGTLALRLDPRTRIMDFDGNDIDVNRLTAGTRVKVSLREEGAGFRVRRVRLLVDSKSHRIRLEGRVRQLSNRENETYLFILGVEALSDSRTAWSRIAKPRYAIDDEDVRPTRGVGLGKMGRLSGEIRLDFIGEDNFNLADVLPGDLQTGRLRGRFEWIPHATRSVSAMLQIKAEEEREITDEADEFSDRSRLTLGRAYVMLHGLIGKHGSLQAGRSRFDDRRDWSFNRDIDALRLFFDWSRWQVQLAVGEELVDPARRHRDVLNTYAAASFYPGGEHKLTAYVLDRDDRFVVNGTPRDFSPRHFGVRAFGETKIWEYWLDAAIARGRDRGVPMRGSAVDAGVTWIAPVALEPSITLGYAMGSGDDDPSDGVSKTFRQTGLHLNNGKFNGVSSFRYYGELMRPELANLHVETLGVGLRPREKTSLDVIFHRYRLDEPASQLIEAAMEDRTLNLIDRDVGTEWDIVFGYEEWLHWELELDIGYFVPGDAFLGPADSAASLRFKSKYIF